MRIAGCVAIVTGAAAGLGYGLSETLLQHGARVVLVDIQVDLLHAAGHKLANKYGKDQVVVSVCDVRSRSSLEEVFKLAKTTLGRLDIVCNNAGVLREDAADFMIDVNLKGVVYGCRLAHEYMSVMNGGSGGVIINTSSIAGLFPTSGSPVYSATKHAVVGLTGSFGVDSLFKKTGIRVNCVCPAFTDTAMVHRMLDSDIRTQQCPDMTNEVYEFTKRTPLMTVDTVVREMIRLIEDDKLNGVAVGIMHKTGARDKIVARI